MTCDPRSVLADFVVESLPDPVFVLGGDGTVVESNRAARRRPDLARVLDGSRSSAVESFLARVRMHGIASTEVLASGSILTLEGVSEREWLVVLVRERAGAGGAAERVPALGVDTAMLLHDFNNILSPLLLLSSRLMHELEDGTVKTSTVDEIHAAATLGATLVQDVLARARGREAAVAPVDVNGVVAARLPVIGGLLGSSVAVASDLASDVGEIFVDRARLEHALLNLVVNARDAMPEGGSLTISTRVVDDATVALAVRDTGVGMPREVRDRAFDAFFTTKRAVGGRGVGLPSVQRFATDHGGRVTLESEPQKGTTATVFLPRERRERAVAAAGE